MVQVHDGGGGPPPLPAGAGPHERALHEIYDFQAGVVDATAEQWRTTSEEMAELAADVRRVVRELRRAPDVGEAWSGPAAAAAYDALGRLAANLDRHAEDITQIEGGLTSASDAVLAARTAYVLTVRPIDIDLDQGDYLTTPVRPLGGAYPDGQVPDTAAYQEALSTAKALREAEAKKVLDAYESRMETATRKLPVEPAESPVSTRTPGGGGGGGGGGASGGGGSGGSYVGPLGPRDGGGGGGGGGAEEPPTFTPVTPIGTGLPEVPDPDPVDPGPVDPEPVGPDPVVLDGPGDGGTLGPSGGGSAPLPGSTGAGGTAGGSGLTGGGMAAGVGGIAAGGGAAALLGRGAPGALGAGRPGAAGAGRAAVLGTTNGGTAARGSGSARAGGATGAGGAGGAGRSTVVGAAGQSGAGRGTAAGGRGAAGGRSGRYGVPQLGEKGGRGGAAVAGTAGSRAGSRDPRDEHDVDRLTHEDEETWFEDADDATPPVWE